MKDQHERLVEANIEAARLDSTITDREQQLQERRIRAGSSDVVLLTPERLSDPDHLEPLKRRGVSLFVVDEAHCISQWGHDFRPAYLELRQAIEALGHPTVLALTATAPADRIEDILQTLGIPGARVVQGGLERENLFLEVARTVNDDEKRTRLTSILQASPGAGIVYASTVRAVNELHEWLTGLGIDAVRYHGQLRASERDRAQERFMSGGAPLIVATNAFGLGIDKPDIRRVVHWNFPESIESYYQEAGRAGRDGRPARCTLLYRLEDKRVRSFLLGGKQPHPEDIQRFLHALRAPASQARGATLAELAKASGLSAKRASVICAGLEAAHVVGRQGIRRRLVRPMSDTELTAFLQTFTTRYGADRNRLHSIMRYGETTLCRMKFIREYFGEPQGEHCGHCDNCRHPVQPGSISPAMASAAS
jgi:ATP-dependent DNA helicase RecQ